MHDELFRDIHAYVWPDPPESDPLDDIPGWFCWPPVYDKLVELAPPGSLLVEVGVWHGRSLAHLARSAAAADKGLRVVGVDHFAGSLEHHFDPLRKAGGFDNFASATLANLRRHGLDGACALWACPSGYAASLVPPAGAFAAFLDAGHEELSVRFDIALWLPRVAPGGWLCGDDYDWEGVKAAVDSMLPDAAKYGRCWAYKVPG